MTTPVPQPGPQSESVPLSVLDLIPVTSGQDVPAAVGNAIDLARRTEEFGYHRFWIAEHHLNPGVAGSAPVVAIALVTAATRTIRVGSGAVLAGNYTALGVLEQFGLIDHPPAQRRKIDRHGGPGAEERQQAQKESPQGARRHCPLPKSTVGARWAASSA